MNDRFGVGLRRELVTALQQFGTQFGVVVNFAVEQHPDRAVLIGHRLVPTGQVDNA